MAPVLEARGLSVKRRTATVLAVDRFSVDEREFLSLVGPNGSGKTTLILALLKLVRTGKGEIIFRGRNAKEEGPAYRYRRNFAAVFQESQLFNTTVYNNVSQGLKIRKRSREETRDAVEKNLERFGISHLKERNARLLSSGESQRVALARAFALEPDIMFLDEPFASLDAPSREMIMRDFETALKESRTTVVMATHDMTEALRLSDTVAVMSGGAILQMGPPEELMRRPVNEFVASFFGNETVLSGAVERVFEGSFLVSVGGRSVEVAGEAPPGSTATFCIGPESIILSRKDHVGASARNRFRGNITRIIPAGFYWKIHVDCGFPLVSYITGHSLKEMGLSEGEEVLATFKSTAIHILKIKV